MSIPVTRRNNIRGVRSADVFYLRLRISLPFLSVPAGFHGYPRRFTDILLEPEIFSVKKRNLRELNLGLTRNIRRPKPHSVSTYQVHQRTVL